jgi:hypothetical protein
MQKRDSERQNVIIDLDRFALDFHPALGGNLIHSTPQRCFSDVTGARNLRPGIGKEVKVCIPQLARWEAEGKSIRIDTGTDLHGHLLWIESLFPKENGKAFQKHHTLFMPRKIFEGIQVSAMDIDESSVSFPTPIV